jgi:hypothetical protein
MGMLGDAIGMQRSEALWRVLVALVWFPIYGTLLVLIWFPIAMIVAIIDVVLQLVLNRESIGYDDLLMDPYWAMVVTLEWVISGKDEPMLIPYV